MNLVFVFGYPGVGKHTVAKELAERLGYGFFYTHAFLQSMYRVFDYDSSSYHSFFKHVLREMVDRAIEDGSPGLVLTFGMDPKMSDDFFGELFDKVENSGGTVDLVELWCDEDRHKERISNEGRKAHGKITAADQVPNLRAEAGSRDFGRAPYRCDSSELSLEDTVRAVLEKLNSPR